jgi:L-methionine (R)-S-oxide reductase
MCGAASRGRVAAFGIILRRDARNPEDRMTRTSDDRLADRYARIAQQLADLFAKTADPVARMATAAAVLHHKMPHYFWTGFYRLQGGRLVVGPYQGPLACAVLPGPEGVCWECVRRGKPVLVPDVHAFPGHVACDSRSRSEVVVPARDRDGEIVGVLDVDSDQPGAFTEVDVAGLVALVELLRTRPGPAS